MAVDKVEDILVGKSEAQVDKMEINEQTVEEQQEEQYLDDDKIGEI